MRRIIVAYHVYMFGDKYKDMITEQLRLLVSSGLFKICDKLYIGVNDAHPLTCSGGVSRPCQAVP